MYFDVKVLELEHYQNEQHVKKVLISTPKDKIVKLNMGWMKTENTSDEVIRECHKN